MKKYFNLLIPTLSLVLLSSCRQEDLNQIVYGQVCTTPALQKPNTDPQQPEENFALNPDTLRNQLLKENTSILLGINQVHQSKDQVNISRAQLLPSLNLSALIYAAGSPTFTMSAVDILLPFLVPSNWSRYKESKHAFYAQIESLKAIRLNVFASAYSLAQSVSSDSQLQQILAVQVQDLSLVMSYVEKLYQNGVTSKSELERVVSQKLLLEMNLSKVEGLLAQEKTALKQLLGLPIKSHIDLQTFTVTSSEFEDLSPAFIYEKALAVSPEIQQLFYLEKAALKNTTTQRYAFINGAGIQSPSLKEGDGSVAFDNISAGASLNIGYAQFPMVELSKDRVKEVQLRTLEAQRELAERSEYALQLVKDAKFRNDLGVQMVQSAKSILDRNQVRYEYGLIDLQTLLQTRAEYNNATIEALRAQTQLSLNRIVLHRLLNTEQFARVNDCR